MRCVSCKGRKAYVSVQKVTYEYDGNSVPVYVKGICCPKCQTMALDADEGNYYDKAINRMAEYYGLINKEKIS